MIFNDLGPITRNFDFYYFTTHDHVFLQKVTENCIYSPYNYIIIIINSQSSVINCDHKQQRDLNFENEHRITKHWKTGNHLMISLNINLMYVLAVSLVYW